MKLNPDPKKYVVKVRRGKAILVDKQILRWRATGKKLWDLDKVVTEPVEAEQDAVKKIKKLLIGS